MKARLILENGMIFEGNAFGYLKDSVGEVVFTTGMTGYQEVLTDPSYYGQIVTMPFSNISLAFIPSPPKIHVYNS